MSDAQDNIIDQIPKAKLAAAGALIYAAKKYNDSRKKKDPYTRGDRAEDLENVADAASTYYLKK
jgi:hypothetical protein